MSYLQMGQLNDQQEPGRGRSRVSSRARTIIIILAIFTFCCYLVSIALYVLVTFHEIPNSGITPLITILSILGTTAGVPAAIIGFLQFMHSILTPDLPQSIPPHSPLTYRNILGVPPPTNPAIIHQREHLVKEIYKLSTQHDATAIAIVGLAHIGKSTLAALVAEYAEKKRHQRIRHFLCRFIRRKRFVAPPLWLHIDSEYVTMTDIAGTLFSALGKPFPVNFNTFNSQYQAQAVYELLNSTKKARLVIIDQLDTLLDVHTGYVLNGLSNVGDWLDTLNSKTCKSCVLFTSRVWPRGKRNYFPIHMKKQVVDVLEIDEGIELLRNHGLDASDDELRSFVKHYNGHVHALTLLATLLWDNPGLTLAGLRQRPAYAHLWNDNIVQHLFDPIFKQQLDHLQRELLLAFSVFHEPMTLEVALSIRDSTANMSQTQKQTYIYPALQGLLAQHLLQTPGEHSYQLPVILAKYVEKHFSESDEHDNLLALREAHKRAADHYESFPSPIQRQSIHDLHFLIEAIRHRCQAGQWPQAYGIIESQNIFSDLKRWGDNVSLQELFQMLLPLSKWGPEPLQEALIYKDLGSICYDLHQNEQALEYYRYALEKYKGINEWRDEREMLDILGKVCCEKGLYDHAKEYYEQAMELYRREGDPIAEGGMYQKLGRVCCILKQKEQAWTYYKQLFNTFAGNGSNHIECITLDNIAALSIEKGNYKVAIACYQYAEQSQTCNGIKGSVKALQKRIGKKEYRSLSNEVDSREFEIIEQAVNH